MGLMWFCLGSLFILALWGLFTWNRRRASAFTPLSWIVLLLTVLQFLFTIAWTVSSMIEGEGQAAGMGLLTFGFITFVLMAFAHRLLTGTVLRPFGTSPRERRSR